MLPGMASILAATGSSVILDTEIVNVGASGANRGFAFGAYGSITDGVFAPWVETITQLFWDGSLTFQIENEVSDSGFTTMTVNGTSFARTGSFFSAGGGTSAWVWSSVSNPFTGTGTDTTVTFT